MPGIGDLLVQLVGRHCSGNEENLIQTELIPYSLRRHEMAYMDGVKGTAHNTDSPRYCFHLKIPSQGSDGMVNMLLTTAMSTPKTAYMAIAETTIRIMALI